MTILSIVIPVYNQWAYTRNCLESFKDLSNQHEIVIVDNGSNDNTELEIKKYLESMHNLKYIRNEKNYGFGGAVNLGFEKSTGNIVMFLNNDIKVKDKNLSWLDDFVKIVIKNDNTLIGPTGGLVDANNEYNFVYETESTDKPINYMSAWCLTATRQTWNSLILNGLNGPFDSKTFFAYFEDTDLSFRAKLQKIKFILHPLPLTHIGKQTSKTLNTNKLYTESKLKFIKKWKYL